MTVVVLVQTLSCPALCHPKDCSPPGSSVHGDSPGQNTGAGSPFLLFPSVSLETIILFGKDSFSFYASPLIDIIFFLNFSFCVLSLSIVSDCLQPHGL